MTQISSRYAALLLSALGLLGCQNDVPCLSQGAVKGEHGACSCPGGMHAEQTADGTKTLCVSNNASTAGDAGGQAGQTGDGGGHDAATGMDASTSGERGPRAVADGAFVSVDAADAVYVDSAVVVQDAGKATCVMVPETCDGKDNDCDGVIDNDVANECGGCAVIDPAHAKGKSCSNGGQGACDLPGVYACLGGVTVCNAPSATPSPEVCDGKDNDCVDGVDNGVLNACGGCGTLAHAKDSPCDNAEKGECFATGVYACTATKDSVSCTAPTKIGTAEVCDGKDNNCDGKVDENAPLWFQDCDGDGFAASTLGAIASCSAPTPVGTCKGWTTTIPSPETKTNWDCDDSRTEYSPAADFGYPPDGSSSYDLNCDGALTRSDKYKNQRVRCSRARLDALNAGNKMCPVDGDPCVAWKDASGLYVALPTTPVCPDMPYEVSTGLDFTEGEPNPSLPCRVSAGLQADQFQCR